MFQLRRKVALTFICTLLIHGAGSLLWLHHIRGYNGAFWLRLDLTYDSAGLGFHIASARLHTKGRRGHLFLQRTNVRTLLFGHSVSGFIGGIGCLCYF